MPLYFFRIEDHHCLDDPDGTDLPDLSAAKGHARAVASELMHNANGVLMGKASSDWTMFVNDADGKQVFAMPLSDYMGHGNGLQKI